MPGPELGPRRSWLLFSFFESFTRTRQTRGGSRANRERSSGVLSKQGPQSDPPIRLAICAGVREDWNCFSFPGSVKERELWKGDCFDGPLARQVAARSSNVSNVFVDGVVDGPCPRETWKRNPEGRWSIVFGPRQLHEKLWATAPHYLHGRSSVEYARYRRGRVGHSVHPRRSSNAWHRVKINHPAATGLSLMLQSVGREVGRCCCQIQSMNTLRRPTLEGAQ